MNPNEAYDNPLFTAYALGELTPGDALRVRQLLAKSPEARAEYERIAQTVGALSQAPQIPRSGLHPRQRETVLAMGQTLARGRMVVPFTGPVARPASIFWSLSKLAAAACLTAGVFMLGQKYAQRSAVPEVAVNAVSSEAAKPESNGVNSPDDNAGSSEIASSKPAAPEATPAAPVPAPEATLPTPPEPVVAISAPELKPAPAPVPVEQTPSAPAPAVAPQPVAQTVVVAAPVAPRPAAASLKAFYLASEKPQVVIDLQPKLVRPIRKTVPKEFAGLVLAAPVSPDKLKPAPKAAAPRKPEPQPPLTIHSWKAEIASCPWDPSRRLMRVVVQFPVDQPGIETADTGYQLAVKFDPAQVQGYRLITEKHMRPGEGSNLATRFAWYEIIPARNFAPTHDKPAALGVIDIVQPRGAPKSSAPLRLLDRGLQWDETREDFVFETAMVGFGLLLQGTENVGSLNQKLVLDLAEQSKGDNPGGERAKFINVVKQAVRAAGL